jgi:hypothetical protein
VTESEFDLNLRRQQRPIRFQSIRNEAVAIETAAQIKFTRFAGKRSVAAIASGRVAIPVVFTLAWKVDAEVIHE